MIYKALEVILIFGAGGRTDGRTGEGVLRGPQEIRFWEIRFREIRFEKKKTVLVITVLG